ncbi:hypothetical protein THRCLA_03790 [Thraustotheca clavata]|uniref:Rab-GAP TBC domain-containing protein n=1 Tax=Thraustotheca clavata TaxID=74557 RepID=A0A1W0A0Z1_9STRA|nr:hypothetical protein THRCLA_03790 [Thraustotheca clavata]
MAGSGTENDYMERSIEEKVSYIYEALQNTPFLGDCRNRLKNELKKQLHAMENDDGMFEINLTFMMQRLGITQSIKNVVMDVHAKATSQRQDHRKRMLTTERKEPMDVIESARTQWNASTKLAFMKYCSEVNVTYAVEATSYVPCTGARFLYSSDDFLLALQQIKPTNRADHDMIDNWSTIKPLLYTKSTEEIQKRYVELGPTHAQFGLDEDIPNILGEYVYINNKNKIGDKVLNNGTVLNARQYAKTGCPINIRPHIWRQALNVVVNAEKLALFEQLQAMTQQIHMATDDIYLLDVQQTTDSSDYFPFEDHLRCVMLAFSRDATIPKQAVSTIDDPILATLKDGTQLNVPPSGVYPISGLVMFAAPLCYLYNDPAHVYFIFREMYCRYWCQLYSISSKPNSILGLCKSFETVIVRTIPNVVYHLVQHGIAPIAIAFPWIQSGFSGILEIDQVLLLWDRVIGYDSLEVLAIFAAALFTFRSQDLLLVLKAEDVKDLFSVALEIQVLPILQQFLFPFYD